MLDFTGFHLEANEGANLTMTAMRQAVAEAGVREVHSKMVVLGDHADSPPGFTSCVLIDESHVTAHCYSDRGWLAIDVFTCGSHSPESIADTIVSDLLEACSSLKLRNRILVPRFLLDSEGDEESKPELETGADAVTVTSTIPGRR